MFCSNCGSKLKEGDKFCSSCGNKISSEKSNTEDIQTVVENEIVTKPSTNKVQCLIHKKDSIKTCRTCGKAICKECDSILDEIENHSYVDEKFNDIGRNRCLDCTLKELSINHFKFNKDLELKFLIALIVSYIIGLLIAGIGADGNSTLMMIIGIVIMGVVPGAKMADFWDSTPSNTKRYEVTYSGFGSYRVRENNGGGLFFLLGLISGVIVTPIFIIKGCIKYEKANYIYKFNEYIKHKISVVLKKVYVMNNNRRTLEALPYEDDGKTYEEPKEHKYRIITWLIVGYLAIGIISSIWSVVFRPPLY